VRSCCNRAVQIDPFADRKNRQPLVLLGLRQHLGHFRRFAAEKREMAYGTFGFSIQQRLLGQNASMMDQDYLVAAGMSRRTV
jgi:hypothetical protein